ncbi:hypothetical protein SLOPH_753 [Spraguea lophii 42_110]|uniref:Uncharacterized protein n=1 Tax=Spraguea lophii (strain 42_110) TaxID=1358809 RepID=S7W9E3_SPRLO|nr:hypothetical protein SLOPH_753 [Spraguea lophii 42_110]
MLFTLFMNDKTIESLIIEIHDLNNLTKEYKTDVDKKNKKISNLNRKIEILEEKIISLSKINIQQKNKILSSQKENKRVEKHLKAIIKRKENNNNNKENEDNILATTIILLGEHYNFDGDIILRILKELKSVDIKLITKIIEKLVIENSRKEEIKIFENNVKEDNCEIKDINFEDDKEEIEIQKNITENSIEEENII